MAQWQGRSRRKSSGGRYRPLRNKRKSEISREVLPALVGEEPVRVGYHARGGAIKFGHLRVSVISVTDPAKHTSTTAKIQNVLENPANPNYVQRNIVTRGAIVQTDKGRVKVTSRPGQSGALAGVLVQG